MAPQNEARLVAADGPLARAVAPVFDKAHTVFDGAPLGFLVADAHARVLQVGHAAQHVRDAIDERGITMGTHLSESKVGTNGVGTVLETRTPMLISGDEHQMEILKYFTCFGHPITHPLTRRIEGVVDVGGAADEDPRYYGPIARALAMEIEERLLDNSPASQRRLMTAFQRATRPKTRPVMVLGEGMVLATQTALDQLQPTDHAAVRAWVESVGGRADGSHRIRLESGRQMELECFPVEGTAGMVVDLVQVVDGHALDDVPAVRGWPMLIAGEPGSGRTTAARAAAGPSAETFDAADAALSGEKGWVAELGRTLSREGAAVIIENAQVLADTSLLCLVRHVAQSPRKVVLTVAVGDRVPDIHPALLSVCDEREDLVPLRLRPEDIPRLVREMLAEEAATKHVRVTEQSLRVLAAQRWPGNLAELRHVVRAMARARSAGDIVPADLPPAYRESGPDLSPIRSAERDVIVAAIEAAGGSKSKAARSLGVSRSTLYNRLRALGVH
ncbi:MAG: helix-turn-helix domain-containing protein [Gordonia sp. (in: high G+C Gram-positive bacteria)]|uniref:helix-turn-helix domain-containing protein n=1 Tax=Gordonia sp. (in: high G+C Gram-positive bacteria) TaxID=84139 RepID=UPI0039E2785F